MTGPDHAAYIWISYGFTGLVVAALLIRAFVDRTVQKRAIARLEQASARRRVDSDG